jgi:hypothetical protein
MGGIAASDTPEAFDLFRQILLASASIPILFPPVYIPVEVEGKICEEMHVDGGLATQVLFYGDIMNLDDAVCAAGLPSTAVGRIYIIQNMQSIPPDFELNPPELFDPEVMRKLFDM